MLRVTQHSRRRPQARRPCSLLPTPVWAPTWQGDPSPAALGGTDPMCGLRRTPGTPKTPSCRPASSANPALRQVPGSPDLYLHLCSPHPGSRSPAAGGTAVRGDRAFPQPQTISLSPHPTGGTAGPIGTGCPRRCWLPGQLALGVCCERRLTTGAPPPRPPDSCRSGFRAETGVCEISA